MMFFPQPTPECLTCRTGFPSTWQRSEATASEWRLASGHVTTASCRRIVEFLADKFKASIYDRTRDGSTLMHIAAINGHPETAVLLFNKGVPLLMPNKYGARGIHIAAKEGHVNVIKTLLAKGEQIDAKTSDNKTALHIAVEHGKSSAVEVKDYMHKLD